MHLRRVVAEQQVFDEQVILCCALAPQHDQNDPFYLFETDIAVIQSKNTVDYPFTLHRIENVGDFEKSEKSATLGINFFLFDIGSKSVPIVLSTRLSGYGELDKRFQPVKPVEG